MREKNEGAFRSSASVARSRAVARCRGARVFVRVIWREPIHVGGQPTRALRPGHDRRRRDLLRRNAPIVASTIRRDAARRGASPGKEEGKRTWRNAVAIPNAAAGFNARLTTNIVSVRLVRLDLCRRRHESDASSGSFCSSSHYICFASAVCSERKNGQKTNPYLVSFQSSFFSQTRAVFCRSR